MPTFWCKCLFSVGNVLLAVRVELSKSRAGWIYDVAFFFSRFKFRVHGCQEHSLRHVLITCLSVTTCSLGLSAYCSALLKYFFELVYRIHEFSTKQQLRRDADPWISHGTLALFVQRRDCVMGADKFWLFEELKWKTTLREPVDSIFTLASGCWKDSYLVIPLQPRKLLIWATWRFQVPGLSGNTAQPRWSHRFDFVFFFPGAGSCPSF